MGSLPEIEPPFSLSGIDHVVLRVPDMARALAFYSGVLGAREERRVDQFGLIQLRAGSSLIDLVDLGAPWLRAEGAKAPDMQARNADHVCLRVAPWDEARIRAYLAHHRIAIFEEGRRYGSEGSGPSFYVRDPFGTPIELKGPAEPETPIGPVLSYGRVTLRPLGLHDTAAIAPLMQDPQTMKYWSTPPMESESPVRAFIAKNLPRPGEDPSIWGIQIAGAQPVRGFVNLYNRQGRISGAGYMLARAFWGQGLVIDAMQALLAHAFTALDLHRIYLDIDPENAASVRVAEKLGFAYEGRTRESFFIDGRYLDSVWYAMLQSDWVRRRSDA